MSTDELRMYIVMRKDVGELMSKGKFGVQCSHAILTCWIDCLKRDPDRAWAYHTQAQPKISMEVKDEKALRTTYDKAIDAGFCAALITDSGRTEFDQPTVTAIAIGPVWFHKEAQTGFIKRLQIYKDKKNLRLPKELSPYLVYLLHAIQIIGRDSPDYIVPDSIDAQVQLTIDTLLDQLPSLDPTLESLACLG